MYITAYVRSHRVSVSGFHFKKWLGLKTPGEINKKDKTQSQTLELHKQPACWHLIPLISQTLRKSTNNFDVFLWNISHIMLMYVFKKIHHMCKESEKIIYLMSITRKYFSDNSECWSFFLKSKIDYFDDTYTSRTTYIKHSLSLRGENYFTLRISYMFFSTLK